MNINDVKDLFNLGDSYPLRLDESSYHIINQNEKGFYLLKLYSKKAELEKNNSVIKHLFANDVLKQKICTVNSKEIFKRGDVFFTLYKLPFHKSIAHFKLSKNKIVSIAKQINRIIEISQTTRAFFISNSKVKNNNFLEEIILDLESLVESSKSSGINSNDLFDINRIELLHSHMVKLHSLGSQECIYWNISFHDLIFNVSNTLRLVMHETSTLAPVIVLVAKILDCLVQLKSDYSQEEVIQIFIDTLKYSQKNRVDDVAYISCVLDYFLIKRFIILKQREKEPNQKSTLHSLENFLFKNHFLKL